MLIISPNILCNVDWAYSLYYYVTVCTCWLLLAVSLSDCCEQSVHFLIAWGPTKHARTAGTSLACSGARSYSYLI